ncbi:hypothetical protein AB0I60_02710 [Actinosynnema sp. NPDC050436]|uniref:hypothetical protein n=1 Tax=Actinosynnema sp. NPDC050436 TaxID=3155659 RepID=UPI0033C74299
MVRLWSLGWWAGRDPDGSKRVRRDLRILTREGLTDLRRAAIEQGFAGRGWREGHGSFVNESAFIWVSGGLELDGVMICDLIIVQHEFKDYESRGTAVQTGKVEVRRHRLDIRLADWRRLRRASRADEWDAYHALESTLPFDLREVGEWGSEE